MTGRRRGIRDRRDDGLTLIELLTAMGIFTIVLVVFISGLLTMTRATVRGQDVTDAGDDLRRAFQTMDKQIRYSSSINFPGTGASGAHYVEFLQTNLPNGQEPLCTQWRYDATARRLEYRTWRDLPTATRSAWRLIATDVRNELSGPTPDLPFILEQAGSTYTKQVLVVSLDIGRGGTGADGGDIETVFVGRNTSALSPSNGDANNDKVSDTPVCTSHLERP